MHQDIDERLHIESGDHWKVVFDYPNARPFQEPCAKLATEKEDMNPKDSELAESTTPEEADAFTRVSKASKELTVARLSAYHMVKQAEHDASDLMRKAENTLRNVIVSIAFDDLGVPSWKLSADAQRIYNEVLDAKFERNNSNDRRTA